MTDEFSDFNFAAPVGITPSANNQGAEFDDFDFSSPIQEPVEQESNDGFVSRTAPQLQARNERMEQDIEGLLSGATSPQEAGLNIVGEVAGSAVDVVGEGLVSAGRGIAAVTPDFIKEPVSEKASELSTQFLQSDIGKVGLRALESGVGVYRKFKERYPREARVIENTLNIGIILAPAKVKAKSPPSRLSKSSDAVKKIADDQIKGNRKKFTEQLVGPKRDINVLKDEVSRTTEVGKGPLKRSVVAPTVRETEIAAEVSKIKTVTPKNTTQGNLNEIVKANELLAVKLKRDVAKSGVKLQSQSVTQQVDDIVDQAVSENVFIVGNGVLAANKMKANASKIIQKHSDADGFISGSELLEARKELDSLIRSQKKNIFNPAMAESAVGIITKDIRSAMNTILDDAVTGSRVIDVSVKDELRRQSLLFGAIENMTPKAAAEGSNAVLRALDNALKVVKFRNESVQLFAIAAGVGGLGAAAMGAGPFRTLAGLTGTAVVGHKILMSPKTKTLVSKTLSLVDEAIRTTESPSMLKALRADRVLIVELLENSVGAGEASLPVPPAPSQEQ